MTDSVALGAPLVVPAAEEVREDALLGGRVRLLQPRHGYRAAIDPVLLAAAVDARPGARVLDAGAGTGAALLCLGARLPKVFGLGLEIQPLAAGLCHRSVRLNGLESRLSVMAGDIARPPPELQTQAPFDVVMTNPPYVVAAAGQAASSAQKDRAHREAPHLPLPRWIDHCLALLPPRGRLVVIQRADRLDVLLAALTGRTGEVTVLPLWPRPGHPASRVIVAARKGLRGPARVLAGLTLHPAAGSGYTPEAEAVLRDAQPLDLQPRGRR